MVYQDADSYLIEYTGIPAESQQFVLHASNPGGFVVKIKYSDSDQSYAIYDEKNKVVAPTEWDDAIGDYKPLQRISCGENRF